MNVTVEQVVQATPEVHDLIGELENVLDAAHQRHGLSIEQLFEPNVRFFLARLGNLAVGCGGVALFDDYAEVKVCIPGQRHLVGEWRRLCCAGSRTRLVEQTSRSCASKRARTKQEAVGLYERMGFRPRGPFGPYAMMPARNIETSFFSRKPCNSPASSVASRRFKRNGPPSCTELQQARQQ